MKKKLIKKVPTEDLWMFLHHYKEIGGLGAITIYNNGSSARYTKEEIITELKLRGEY